MPLTIFVWSNRELRHFGIVPGKIYSFFHKFLSADDHFSLKRHHRWTLLVLTEFQLETSVKSKLSKRNSWSVKHCTFKWRKCSYEFLRNKTVWYLVVYYNLASMLEDFTLYLCVYRRLFIKLFLTHHNRNIYFSLHFGFSVPGLAQQIYQGTAWHF